MAIEAERLEVTVTGEGTGELSEGLTRIDKSAVGARKAVAGLGTAIGTAAAVITGQAIQAASEWNNKVREMERVTDPQTAQELDKSIRDLAETIPIATKELGNIAAEAGRFGIEGSKNIEQFTETVAKMASATNLSTDQAGEAFAKLSDLTNTPIDDINRLGSSINSLANDAATSADEIVQNMMESSSTLSNMGANQKEIAGLAASMNEMYNSASKAGRGLRRVGQEMMDPRKAASLASALGVNVDEFKRMRQESPVQTMKTLAREMNSGGKEADLLKENLSSFSRQALSNLGKNLESTNKNLQTSKRAFRENKSVQEEFETANRSLDAHIQRLRNTINNTAVDIGRVFIPYIKTGINVVNNAVQSFDSFVKSGNETEVAIGLAATAVGGFTAALASLASMLGGPALAAASGYAATIAGPFTAAFISLSGTIGAATSAVGTFVAGLGPVATMLGTISGLAGTVTAGLTSLGATLTVMSPTLGSVVGLVTALSTSFGSVIAPVTATVGALGSMTTGLVAVLGPIGLVVAAIGGLGYAIKNNQQVIANFTDKAIKNIENVARDGANWLEKNGPPMVKKAFRAIGEGIRFVALDIYNAITGNGDSVIKSIIIDAGTWIKNNGPGILKRSIEIALDVIWAAFEGLYEGLIGNSIVPDIFTDIGSYIRSTGKRLLAGAAGAATGAVVDKFTGMAGDVGRAVSGMISDAKETISDGVSNMKSTFNDAIPDSVGIDESFSLPSVTLGGGEFMGKDVPEHTIGGDRYSVSESIDLPQLDTGGYIEEDGLAYLHAGEEVVRSAEVDRSGDAGSGSGGDTYKFEIYAPHSDAGEIRRDLADEFRSAGF